MAKETPWYKKSGFLISAVLGVCLLVVVFYSRHDTASSVSEQAYNPSDTSQQDSLSKDKVNGERLKKLVQTYQNKPVDTTALDQQINAIISANSEIVFSVSIQDLGTGSVHNYGSPEAMTAASVTKVLTAIDYMKQVELGNKSLDTIMVDGNTAEYDIEQMIVVSDNDAWHVLNNSLTYTQMQSYAESIGLHSYYYGDNIISASDVTAMLANLYQRKLINETHTQLLLSYMERANYRDLIIPAVPAHDTVYHKAGELYGNLHDATIITNGSQTIVLTIFTESLYSYSKSAVASLMQQITTPTLETFRLN